MPCGFVFAFVTLLALCNSSHNHFTHSTHSEKQEKTIVDTMTKRLEDRTVNSIRYGAIVEDIASTKDFWQMNLLSRNNHSFNKRVGIILKESTHCPCPDSSVLSNEQSRDYSKKYYVHHLTPLDLLTSTIANGCRTPLVRLRFASISLRKQKCQIRQHEAIRAMAPMALISLGTEPHAVHSCRPVHTGDDSKIMPLVLLSFYLQKQLFYFTYDPKPVIISLDQNKIYS